MIKLVLNNDNEHVWNVQNINYNISFGIDSYSNHSEQISCSVVSNNIENVNFFENKEITSIAIYDDEESVATLSLSNVYITNGNITLYDKNALFNVTLNSINLN